MSYLLASLHKAVTGLSKLCESVGCIIMTHDAWWRFLAYSSGSLRAVVNPACICLELVNHLDLKGARMGGEQAGGSVLYSNSLVPSSVMLHFSIFFLKGY